MTAPEQLRITGPEDVLGYIPHSLGYWPKGSLVVITMQGKRLGATLRLDLPAGPVLANPGRYLSTVRGYLEADTEADGTLVAVFTGGAAASASATYGHFLAELDSILSAAMPVREAWYVGTDYWREAYCIDATCCPFPGRPLQEILDSPVNAEMVYRGSSVGPAPEPQSAPAHSKSAQSTSAESTSAQSPPPHGATARTVPSLHREAVLEAEAGWAGELDLRRGSRAQLLAVLDLWEAVLARPQGEPWLPEVERDAFLRASLLIPGWRDAVLVMAAAGKNAAEAGAAVFGIVKDGTDLRPVTPPVPFPAADPPSVLQRPFPAPVHAVADHGVAGVKANSPAGVNPGYADVLMGVQPDVPDWAALDALDVVLDHLAAVGGPAAAAALTVRGWISWCRGRGSYAAAHFASALEVQPGYRFAELLLELVGRGAICGWAGRKEAAWQKF